MSSSTPMSSPPLRLCSAAKGGAGRCLIRAQPTPTNLRHPTALTTTLPHAIRADVHLPTGPPALPLASEQAREQ